MAVGIARADGDDGIFRPHRLEKFCAGGGIAAVVADLQHRRVQPGPGLQQVLLRHFFHIPGEEEGRLAVIYPQDEGGVIDLRVIFQRPRNSTAALPRENWSPGLGTVSVTPCSARKRVKSWNVFVSAWVTGA